MSDTTHDLVTPVITQTPSGDKLIIFTPGKGAESREECDVIVNDFIGYSHKDLACPHEGWHTISQSINRGWHGESILSFTAYIPEDIEDMGGRTFEYYALSYKTGEVRIAAVKTASSGVWYLNIE